MTHDAAFSAPPAPFSLGEGGFLAGPDRSGVLAAGLRDLRGPAPAEVKLARLMARATRCADARQPAETMTLLALAVALDGLDPVGLRRAVDVARQAGSLRGAWRLQRLLLAQDPTVEAWMGLAGLAAERGHPRAALACHRRAMAVAPRSIRPWNRVFAVLRQQVSHTASALAMACAEDRLGTLPGLSMTRLRAAWQSGEGALCDTLLTREVPPRDLPERAEIAVARALSRDDIATAEAELSALPDPQRGLRLRAAILGAQGRHDEALHLLQAGPEDSPERLGALAEVQIRARLWPEAYATLAPLRREVRRARGGKRALRHLLALVDDLVADRALIAQARGCDPAGLARLAEAEPQSLMLALMVLDLPHARPAPAAPIPQRIVQYWEGPAPGRDLIGLRDSWRRHHPDWEHRLVTRAMAQTYLRRAGDPVAAQAFARARTPAARAALVRAAVLLREGGLWAAPDARCQQSLATLTEGASVLVQQDGMGLVEPGLVGCAPGSALARLALRDAVQSVLRDEADADWLSLGKGALTRAAAAAALSESLRALPAHRARAWVALDCPVTQEPAADWLGFDPARYFG